MIHCKDCLRWDDEQEKRWPRRAKCAWLSSKVHSQLTRHDFGCVDGLEKKPFFVTDHGVMFRATPDALGSGKVIKDKRTREILVDWLNAIWTEEQTVKGIDNTDIAPLYRTVGSKMWLASLTNDQLKAIATDIYEPLLDFLWCAGLVVVPEMDRE